MGPRARRSRGDEACGCDLETRGNDQRRTTRRLTVIERRSGMLLTDFAKQTCPSLWNACRLYPSRLGGATERERPKCSRGGVPPRLRSGNARRARTSQVAGAGGGILLQFEVVSTSIPNGRHKRLTGAACQIRIQFLLPHRREVRGVAGFSALGRVRHVRRDWHQILERRRGTDGHLRLMGRAGRRRSSRGLA